MNSNSDSYDEAASKHQSRSKSASFCTLCKAFAMQSSAHGLRRAATASSFYPRIFWLVVLLLALAGCTFHCLFLVQTYLDYPRMTITEEIHAEEISFPSLTVCNLNVLKKSYIDRQQENLRKLTMAINFNLTVDSLDVDPTAFCYRSVDEFLHRSKTLDLSDIWMSLTVTKDSLQKFGHQEDDLIVHCTYNARNCFNHSHSIVLVSPYPSPRYGLCHTLSVDRLSLQKVTRPGLTLGLRLTLNIQRDEYLDLLSPEYGARLLVHPPGTYPTLQRGGVVLQPGTKTYVSVRMRKIDRLPWPYGECTDVFENSPLANHLQKTGQGDLLKHRIYTYEYCQTLCRDASLMKQCDCSEEVTQGNSKFCDQCNLTQARCRTNFLRTFNRNARSQECHKFCKPACSDIRYDLTVSRSEWPNERHQVYVLKRWPSFRSKFGTPSASGNSSADGDGQFKVDINYIKKNFLRVHVFIQEMNYLSVKDVPAYVISQLFADLGGCLGLYIGVSLITILEVLQLFTSMITMVHRKWRSQVEPTHDNSVAELHWVAAPSSKKVRIVCKRGKCCVPQTTPALQRGSRNKRVSTLHLSPGCISPLRQLPSPIFMKNFSSNYNNPPTTYSSPY